MGSRMKMNITRVTLFPSFYEMTKDTPPLPSVSVSLHPKQITLLALESVVSNAFNLISS